MIDGVKRIAEFAIDRAGEDVASIALSPGGDWLVVRTQDDAVLRYGVDGRLVWRTPCAATPMNGQRLEVDPSGAWVLSPDDDQLRRLAAADGALEETYESVVTPYNPRISSDGRWVAWVDLREKVQILDDRLTGLSEFNAHDGARRAECLAWRPHTSHLGVIGDARLVVYDVATQASVAFVEGVPDCDGDGARADAVFSPDGRRFAYSAMPDGVAVCDLDAGSHIHVDLNIALCLGLHWPRPDALLVGCSREGVMLVRPDTGAVERLDTPPSSNDDVERLRAFSVSANGGAMAVARAGGRIEVSDISAIAAVERSARTSPLRAYAERQAATVGRRARLSDRSYAPEGWFPNASLNGEDLRRRRLGVFDAGGGRGGANPGIALKSDGRTVAVAVDHDEETVALWRIGDATHEMISIGGYAWSMDWRPGGAHLALGFSDRPIRVYDCDTRRVVWDAAETCPAASQTFSIAFSPDGARLAGGGDNRAVHVLDAETGAEIVSLDERGGAVESLAWSPDGGFLAAAFHGQAVVVWETRSWSRIAAFAQQTEAGFRAIAFSPNSDRLIASGYGYRIEQWRLPSGAALAPIDLDLSLVRSDWYRAVKNLGFSSDGSLIAALDGGGEVFVVDVATEQVVHQANVATEGEETGGNGKELAWSSSGGFFVTSHHAPLVAVWDVRDVGRVRSPSPAVEEAATSELAEGLVALSDLGLTPPLSLLEDLLAVLGGDQPRDPSVSRLLEEESVQALAALAWPTSARVGLAGLLLAGARLGDDWRPPSNARPAALRDDLSVALSGERVARAPALTPLARLVSSARSIDPMTATLLGELGPNAIARAPGLAIRVAAAARGLPTSARPNRRLLGRRLPQSRSGRSSVAGAAGPISGLARRGPPQSLASSELALAHLAPRLFDARGRRGETIYRARAAIEPPRLRPAVLILDASSAAPPAMSSALRAAAHIVAASLIEAETPAELIVADTEPRATPLRGVEDLLAIWEADTRTLASEADAVAEAARRLPQLSSEGPLSPVAIVFSHAHFGADGGLPPVRTLRAVLMRFPAATGAATSPLASAAVWLEPGVDVSPDRLARLFVDVDGAV